MTSASRERAEIGETGERLGEWESQGPTELLRLSLVWATLFTTL